MKNLLTLSFAFLMLSSCQDPIREEVRQQNLNEVKCVPNKRHIEEYIAPKPVTDTGTVISYSAVIVTEKSHGMGTGAVLGAAAGALMTGGFSLLYTAGGATIGSVTESDPESYRRITLKVLIDDVIKTFVYKSEEIYRQGDKVRILKDGYEDIVVRIN